MAQSSLPMPHEIHARIHSLQGELEKLDAIGAGIAAIHVNAAIEQLYDNLGVANDAEAGAYDPAMLCLVSIRREAAGYAGLNAKD